MHMQDMALSFVYRIPMLRSTVETLNLKYNEVKSRNNFAYLILSFVELCFYVIAQLFGQIQTCDYKKYWAYLNNYVYIFVCQYVTPALWTQAREVFQGSVQFIMEASKAVFRYVEHVHLGLRGFGSPHTTVNFDSPNMNTFIDLITRSLAELKLKENSLLELGGYENEFHKSGTNVEHSSTSCQCDKHHNHVHHGYINNNNLETLPSTHQAEFNQPDFHPTHEVEFEQTVNDDASASTGSGSVDDNIMAETYTDNNEDLPLQPEDQDPIHDEHLTPSVQEWHKVFPTSFQPLIPMMTAANAFALAEALKEKRVDRTGRDAYEVDTILILLSQWDVIDQRSRHYAVDRANILFLAISYGWSYALQKVSPTTTVPIVTPSATNIEEPPPLQRQLALKKKKKTYISRSYGSVYSNYSNDSREQRGYYYNNNQYFQRPNGVQNYNRQSFPPNMYHRQQYHNGYFYPK